MADEAPPVNLVALRDARERVIAQLSDAFARDTLEIDEFERRLTLAHRADSIAQLDRLVNDVAAPAQPAAALVPAPAPAPVLAADRQTVAAILGGVTRRGPWRPPRRLRVLTIMGGAVLDFREAALPPGVTEIEVVALMGGAHIIVPPQLAVEMSGMAVMGGFDHAERAPLAPDPERPVLRIRGFAMMGGVHVATRLPGQPDEMDPRRLSRHARRAERLARREERRALRHGRDARLLP